MRRKIKFWFWLLLVSVSVFKFDALAQENQLFQLTFDGTSWGDWQPRGGLFAGNPAVISLWPTRIDVFVRGA